MISMYIYQNNHYIETVDHMINECIKHAQANPFQIHYLIVDDESYFEEIILKKIPYIFNIEIVSLLHLFEKITNAHQQVFLKKSTYDNIIEIFRLLKNNPSVFEKSMNLFLTAKNILKVFENFYLYEIHRSAEGLSNLSQRKINTLLHLYDQFEKTAFMEYDFITALIDQNDNNAYYFLISDQNNPKIRKMISRLDQFGDVYILGPGQYIENDYSSYVCRHLFDSYQSQKDIAHPYQILSGANIEEEIKQVVFDLFLSLKNHHCYDFAIYYPNEEYYLLLTRQLDQFQISYNHHETIENYALRAIKDLLHYLSDDDENWLLSLISSGYLQYFQDIRYVSLLKKQFYQQKIIHDEFYQQMKNDILAIRQYHTIESISQALITFIQQYFLISEDTLSLKAKLDQINDQDIVSLNEYLQLLEVVITKQTKYTKPKYDSVYLLSYQQPYSELLHVKMIYCLGLNETVIPQEFKNTQLLLNPEAESLGYPTTYDLMLKHHKQLEHVFANRHHKIILSYALRNNDGSELVISSLVKKINTILPVKIMKKHDLLHFAMKEELYLKNEEDENYTILNDLIHHYQQSKNQVDRLNPVIEHNPLSASKLETYNQCPYKYFHQYVMNIDEIRDYRLQSNEIGTMVHYVLEKNSKYFCDNHKKTFNQLQKDINNSIDAYLKQNSQPKMALPQNQFFIQLIKEDLYNTIIILSQQMEKGLFVLHACEQRVYDQLDDLELKGFIDRVDIFQNQVKVIDYKSSQKKLDLNLARLGFKIQMLLYLEMLTKKEHIEKGAVLYFNTKKRLLKSEISILEKQNPDDYFKLYKMDGYSIDQTFSHIDSEIEKESSILPIKLKKDGTPDKKSKVITKEEMNDIIHDIANHIQHLYQQMTQGDISIFPTKSDNSTIDQNINPCPYCSYRPLCHYDVFYNEDHLIEPGGQNEKR